MNFIPHDKNTISQMLHEIGVSSIIDLFHDIPKELRIDQLDLPAGQSEPDLLDHLRTIAGKNKTYPNSFLGAGCYYHYIPSLVDFVISLPSFYTAYTPYQAEASQGYLQAIFEYQTAIARLTGMDVANASMYDGSTALAEAAIMACGITNKKKVLLLEGIHPEYVSVARTYCWGREIEIEEVNFTGLLEKLDGSIGGVLIQSPNFFGEIEDMVDIVRKVRERNSRAVVVQCMTDPSCLGVLKPPGEVDVDIFVAEGQALGIAPSFGGPNLGIFTTKQKYLRKMPGRLIGKTKELDGEKEGYILTLQAREQHIRREKAMSNICSNQALCMLASLVYLLSMGRTGLSEIAKQNIQKTHYLKTELGKIPGYRIANEKPTYNEFVLECPDPSKLRSLLEAENLLPPLPLTQYFPDRTKEVLVCVTELTSEKTLATFVRIARDLSEQTAGGAK